MSTREPEKMLADADEAAWAAGATALQEVTNDRTDYDRIEQAALEMLATARRAQVARRYVESDGQEPGDEL